MYSGKQEIIYLTSKCLAVNIAWLNNFRS